MTVARISLTAESLAELTGVHTQPCLSLYQTTHRRRPASKQDPVRFRNLVRNLTVLLKQHYPDHDPHVLLEPLEALAQDPAFWEQTLNGLAVFASAPFFRVFLLQSEFAEFASVADIFHLLPLRRYLQTAGRYHVLWLCRDKMRLFEGNRDVLDEILLPAGFPRTIVEALGEEVGEAHQTVANYGSVGKGDVAMHHGIGSKKDEVKSDDQKFFRAVDRAVLEKYSRPSGLPLILASLPEHHHLFHQISHNPFLMIEGIPINPDAISVEDLQHFAWKIVEKESDEYQGTLVAEFLLAQSKGLGSDNFEQANRAAAIGRVATLLIGDQSAASIDKLAESVEKDGGTIRVLPADLMPGKTGVAAIYRY